VKFHLLEIHSEIHRRSAELYANYRIRVPLDNASRALQSFISLFSRTIMSLFTRCDVARYFLTSHLAFARASSAIFHGASGDSQPRPERRDRCGSLESLPRVRRLLHFRSGSGTVQRAHVAGSKGCVVPSFISAGIRTFRCAMFLSGIAQKST